MLGLQRGTHGPQRGQQMRPNDDTAARLRASNGTLYLWHVYSSGRATTGLFGEWVQASSVLGWAGEDAVDDDNEAESEWFMRGRRAKTAGE